MAKFRVTLVLLALCAAASPTGQAVYESGETNDTLGVKDATVVDQTKFPVLHEPVEMNLVDEELNMMPSDEQFAYAKYAAEPAPEELDAVYNELDGVETKSEEIIIVKPTYEEIDTVEPLYQETTVVTPPYEEIDAVEPSSGPSFIAKQSTNEELVAVEPAFEELVAVEPAFEELVAVEPAFEELDAVEPAFEQFDAVEPAFEEFVAVEPAFEELVAVKPVFEELGAARSVAETDAEVETSHNKAIQEEEGINEVRKSTEMFMSKPYTHKQKTSHPRYITDRITPSITRRTSSTTPQETASKITPSPKITTLLTTPTTTFLTTPTTTWSNNPTITQTIADQVKPPFTKYLPPVNEERCGRFSFIALERYSCQFIVSSSIASTCGGENRVRFIGIDIYGFCLQTCKYSKLYGSWLGYLEPSTIYRFECIDVWLY